MWQRYKDEIDLTEGRQDRRKRSLFSCFSNCQCEKKRKHIGGRI